jgi:hypothetical protein
MSKEFNRGKAIDTLVGNDMSDIENGSWDFLNNILLDGWTGYREMSNEQLMEELNNRELFEEYSND